MRDELSIPALMARRAEQAPDGILIEEVGAVPCRNAEFHRRSLAVADALATLGVGPGDTVAVMLEACTLAHVCWIGIAWLRALEVPINPEFRGATLVHALNDPKARILITTNALLERVSQVQPQLSALSLVITIDEHAPASTLKVITLREALARAVSRAHAAPDVSDPYAVVYTSGTSGPSKGVVVPWANIQAAIAQQFPDDHIAAYDDPAFYCPWPTFHASGKVGLVFAVIKQARLVLRRRLSISAYWHDVGKHRCTHTQMMGLAGLLMAQPPSEAETRTPLRRVLMNPVIPDFRAFEQRFGVRVSTGWGATEIGFPISTSELPNDRSCGRLSADYEVRIVDDLDRDVADGEAGQLIIRARRPGLMMIGYHGRPEATAKAWRNGWFHTGDAMRRDGDGYYYFVDRVADYMRVRGNNVSSFEVEAEVLGHPEVQECAAIAVPSGIATVSTQQARQAQQRGDLALDDDIKVVVVRRPGSTLSPEDLMRYLMPRMPRFMLPRYIELADALPRTPTGKVRKQALRDRPLDEATWDRAAAGIEVPR